MDEFFDALHEGSHSTRIEYAHAALIAVVNDVLYEFDFEPSQIATLWMWVDERTVVTARLQPLRSIDRLRAAVKRGEIFGSSVALLTHLLRDQADVLVQIVRAATGRVDEVEDSLLAERVTRSRTRLGALRRVLVRLRRRSRGPCSGCSTSRRAGWRMRTCRNCAIRPKSSRPCWPT